MPKVSSYSVSKKIEVINWHRSNGASLHRTAKHFRIDRKRIREWLGQEQLLLANNYGEKKNLRKLKAGRKPLSEELDEALFEFLEREREKGLVVTNRMLKAEALRLATSLNMEDDFKASNMYVKRWTKRYVSTRKGTNDSQKLPADYADAVMAQGFKSVRKMVEDLVHSHESQLYNPRTEKTCRAHILNEICSVAFTIDTILPNVLRMKFQNHFPQLVNEILEELKAEKKIKSFVPCTPAAADHAAEPTAGASNASTSSQSAAPQQLLISPRGNPDVAKNRCSYTASFKLTAVKKAEELGNRKASRVLDIDESRLRLWRKEKKNLENLPRDKKANRGCPPRWPELESELFNWIEGQSSKGIVVSYQDIRVKAKALAVEKKLEDFPCSNRWFLGFMKRKKLSPISAITTALSPSTDQSGKFSDAMADCEEVQEVHPVPCDGSIRQKKEQENFKLLENNNATETGIAVSLKKAKRGRPRKNMYMYNTVDVSTSSATVDSVNAMKNPSNVPSTSATVDLVNGRKNPADVPTTSATAYSVNASKTLADVPTTSSTVEAVPTETEEDWDLSKDSLSVSSVHTSELSSFDDAISISSEDGKKKRLSIKEIQQVTKSEKISSWLAQQTNSKSSTPTPSKKTKSHKKRNSSSSEARLSSSDESDYIGSPKNLNLSPKVLPQRTRKPNSKYVSESIVCPIAPRPQKKLETAKMEEGKPVTSPNKDQAKDELFESDPQDIVPATPKKDDIKRRKVSFDGNCIEKSLSSQPSASTVFKSTMVMPLTSRKTAPKTLFSTQTIK